MYSLLSWFVIGLTIGIIARVAIPGPRRIGVGGTIALGVLGAMLGGLISTQLWKTFAPDEPDMARMWPSWLMAMVGAMAVLWTYMHYLAYPPVRIRR